MSRISQLCLVALLGLGFAVPAFAEIIVLPDGQVQAAKLPKQPERGMSMQQVRSRFGAPSQKLAPTPTAPNYPTITRWVYPDYTVYFANHYVIHTVVHNSKAPHPALSGTP